MLVVTAMTSMKNTLEAALAGAASPSKKTELERLELIVKDKDKYKGNIELLHGYMPIRKTK